MLEHSQKEKLHITNYETFGKQYSAEENAKKLSDNWEKDKHNKGEYALCYSVLKTN